MIGSGKKLRIGIGKKLGVGVLSLMTLVGVITAAHAQGSRPAENIAHIRVAGPAVNIPTPLGRNEGAAFAMTNRSDGNQIIIYKRAANGVLHRTGSISTRGLGIGTDLDTQGPLQLSSDHHFLYAVNAGSDDVTVFAVNGTHLRFVQKVYAGDEPNSLTIHGNLLYVLDGSVAANGIRGFRVHANGTLAEIPNSVRLLSSPIAVPGTVQFSPDGTLLLVTEKTTNLVLYPHSAIDAFQIATNGLASVVPQRDASNGVRPFSLAFRNDSQLLVAESFDATPGKAAVSSYQVNSHGLLTVTSGSIRNQQTDTCWIVITKDGRYAYTANFGSGTISSYGISSTGTLQLIRGSAAFLGMVSQPVDLALTANSHFLYLLLRGSGAVAAFSIATDGDLQPLGVVAGALPVADGASGLAVY